ncbi:MAG: HPP family protein [Pseudomonadota bacterium]
MPAIAAAGGALATLGAWQIGALTGFPALPAPVAAAALVVLAAPQAPAARPRAVVLAHLVCLIAGGLGASLPFEAIAAIPLAVGAAAAVMLAARAVHAPAIAHTVIMIVAIAPGLATLRYAAAALAAVALVLALRAALLRMAPAPAT